MWATVTQPTVCRPAADRAAQQPIVGLSVHILLVYGCTLCFSVSEPVVVSTAPKANVDMTSVEFGKFLNQIIGSKHNF